MDRVHLIFAVSPDGALRCGLFQQGAKRRKIRARPPLTHPTPSTLASCLLPLASCLFPVPCSLFPKTQD
ncbi:hypothetical protein [Moorena producens]|uniref:hypothetical protein n=1 Tax=Moorena producens TaxID=1155739 RepID=UPI003C71BEAA